MKLSRTKIGAISITLACALGLSMFAACKSSDAGEPLTAEPKDASAHTIAVNRGYLDLLDFSDEQELEFVRRGLLAAPDSLEFRNENGDVIFSQDAFEFIGEDVPDTDNPSLWRHTRLNHIYGLFEVMDGIYQVRGYDITNLTVVRGDTGWIVLDPGTVIETMQASMQLVNEVLGELPIMAIIISHPHGDHYGGIKGIITEEEIRERNVPIIVPEHFERHAVSENIYAGVAMMRRASYQFGTALDPGPKGRLALGLGVTLPANGATSYVSPTHIITHTGETLVIDGVTMEFQLTPGTEAPAEMNTWFPDLNALWLAENCVGTLHNLYTVRGAQVRDGNAWAYYIMETITLYGDAVEVTFQSHNWPRWGNEVIVDYLTNTAAVYKFINDQTLLYMNQGYTSKEIGDMIQLPDDLEKVWYTRPYYGTVAHNSRGVYQRFLGYYDANPATLNPIPPTESAVKFVEYMKDMDEVMRLARRDFDNGEYRWVAELASVLVFADPGNTQARLLGADALEQLAYQAESGVWRSAYLTGARELREGGPVQARNLTVGSDLYRSMHPSMILDYLGIRIDSNSAQDLNLKINYNVIGDTQYLVTVRAGVVLYQADVAAADADVTVTVPKELMFMLMSPDQWRGREAISITGDAGALDALYAHFSEMNPQFNIIEP